MQNRHKVLDFSSYISLEIVWGIFFFFFTSILMELMNEIGCFC